MTGNGTSPATPDQIANRSTSFEAVCSRSSGASDDVDAMASLSESVDPLDLCAMAYRLSFLVIPGYRTGARPFASARSTGLNMS
jgi:hypothetical protein